MTPDRSKIDAQDAKQLKFWLKSLGVSKEDLLEAIGKVGNAAATVRKELQGKGLAAQARRFSGKRGRQENQKAGRYFDRGNSGSGGSYRGRRTPERG
jgi:Protein of unknown function (DUF3606)